MKKEWIFKSESSGEKSLIKRLLAIRGITGEKEIKEFLNPLETELTSPNVFTDMQKTVERLSYAIENKETIVIYGDFDADGVTSTSVLYKTLKFLGANVHYMIPDREKEGHGLNYDAILKLKNNGIKPNVIITVDCGISDADVVRNIKSFKIVTDKGLVSTDVIITDHHEAPEVLPDAYAIINPKAPNSLDENLSAKQIEYLTYLAGCGVAFKVAQALLTHYNKPEFIYEILPFVAVGTVADVVPLLGENRYFVTKGLDLISKGKHVGLTRLLASINCDITKGVTSENIAFGIAPRINASGRLDTVEDALKVLLSDNVYEIDLAINNLNEFNKTRQTLCNNIFAQADEMVKKEGNKNPAIILYSDDWRIGVIGIVASKLVEKYYKPVFLMSYIKETDQFRCSARSIEGVPLYDVLDANAELFDGFGGHKMAAGLSFTGSKTPFEIVKKALNNTVQEYLSGRELKPFVDIDLLLEPEDISVDLVEDIAKLEPFGASNPTPVFALKDMTVADRMNMGSDKSHLKMTLQAQRGIPLTAIWWKRADATLQKGDSLDIAFRPQINEFNGNISVQLVVEDIHSDGLVYDDEQAAKYKIYDHRSKTNILNEVNDYLKTSKNSIKIFAESKVIVDMLRPYQNLFNSIFTRQDIPNCDAVMFFDYPADRETLNIILEKSSPKSIHFMNYEIKTFDEQELLKIFSGMIRYSVNHESGKFGLIRCASSLGKSVKVVEMLLDLLCELNFIKIIEKNSSFYSIELVENIDASKILDNPKFAQIYELCMECEEFQKSLLEDDLEELL